MHHKKNYSFRIDTTLIKELDKLEKNRTTAIQNAIQMYIKCNTKCNTNNIHIQDTDKQLALDYIQELKKDKQILQQRLDYFMTPWYARLLLPKPKRKKEDVV